jgi:hypothetical protein
MQAKSREYTSKVESSELHFFHVVDARSFLQIKNDLIHALNNVERAGFTDSRSTEVSVGNRRLTEHLFQRGRVSALRLWQPLLLLPLPLL